MPLIINGTEVEHVIFKAPGINQEVDEVYANSTLVFVSTIFVPKPTISGTFTFDNSAKSPTVTGYDAAAMTKTGTESATAAGSYSITYTPNSGYAWTDGTTAPVTLNWSIAKRLITIPSISNTSKTYNGTAQSPTIANVTSGYVTQSGTASATNAGSYSVTWALKYSASTTWTDNTTANKTGSWSIGKLSVTIPSLSGTTSFAYVQGASHSVSVANRNATYVNQSGNTSVTDGNAPATQTITWSLVNTSNTQWTDKTTANKTATWGTTWVNGTSHYSNDLYNKGWGSSNIEWRNSSGDTSPTFNSDNITYHMNVFRTKSDYAAGKVFHISLKVSSGSHSITILDVKGSDWSWTTAISSTIGTSYTEMSTAHVTGNPGTFGRFGIRSSSQTWDIVIQRIWIT